MIKPSPDCPLSPCVSLLAGAWTLEILYLTSLRAMHFGELRRALAKVSSKVLSGRLRELEARGVIRRRTIATKPPMVEYSLTETGRELMPVLEAVLEVSRKLRGDVAKAGGRQVLEPAAVASPRGGVAAPVAAA